MILYHCRVDNIIRSNSTLEIRWFWALIEILYTYIDPVEVPSPENMQQTQPGNASITNDMIQL